MKKVISMIAVLALTVMLFAGCGTTEPVSTDLGQAEKVIILVLDGFSSSYLSYLGTNSNFAKLAKAGTCCLTAESTYPSHTFTAHSTIMTGVSPDTHGVIGNVHLAEDGVSSEKNMQPEMLQADTLFQIAKASGKKTAMVSGKNNLVTLFSTDLDVGASNMRLLDYLGEAPILDEAENNEEYYEMNLELAQWVFESTYTVLETESPDLMLVNVQSADYVGHRFGPESDELKNTVKQIDKALGELYKKMKNSGMLENTALLITADHGMTSSNEAINLNTLVMMNFPDAGVAIDGRTGYIWLNGTDQDAVIDFFSQIEGVSEIIEKGSDRSKELRVDCEVEPDLILNTEDGCIFLPEPMLYLYNGQHGSTSDSDVLVPVIWVGAGIPAGAGIETTDLRSIAPMTCYLMGLTPGEFELSVPTLIGSQDLSAFR